MKKNTLLIIAILIIVGSTAFSQDDFTTYDNLVAQETYQIQISDNEKNGFTLWIDAFSFDDIHKRGGISVKEKSYPDFIKSLYEAKQKYVDWKKTAIDNNVTDLRKEIPTKSRVSGYFLYGSEWKFQNMVNLTFEFRIMDSEGDVKYYLIVRTGKLKASTNEYMDMDGFALIFTSVPEMEEFIDSISQKNITDFFNKPKTEDLFL